MLNSFGLGCWLGVRKQPFRVEKLLCCVFFFFFVCLLVFLSVFFSSYLFLATPSESLMLFSTGEEEFHTMQEEDSDLFA